MKNFSQTQQQTHTNFINAFLEIYDDVPIEKISIKMITDRAGYNRSSFYLYFADVYALRNAAENELLQELQQAVENIFESNTDIHINDFINSFAAVASPYSKRVHLFCQSESFRRHLFEMVKPIFMKINNITEMTAKTEYMLSFVFNIMLHNVDYCYNHQNEITLREAIEYTNEIISPGIQNFIC